MRKARRAGAAQVAVPSGRLRSSLTSTSDGPPEPASGAGPRIASCRKIQGWRAAMRARPRAFTTAVGIIAGAEEISELQLDPEGGVQAAEGAAQPHVRFVP